MEADRPGKVQWIQLGYSEARPAITALDVSWVRETPRSRDQHLERVGKVGIPCEITTKAFLDLPFEITWTLGEELPTKISNIKLPKYVVLETAIQIVEKACAYMNSHVLLRPKFEQMEVLLSEAGIKRSQATRMMRCSSSSPIKIGAKRPTPGRLDIEVAIELMELQHRSGMNEVSCPSKVPAGTGIVCECVMARTMEERRGKCSNHDNPLGLHAETNKEEE